MVIWVVGLSGAGKTTIGRALYDCIKSSEPSTVFLDGDAMRTLMGDDLGYSEDDRYRSALRTHNLCRMLDAQSIHVVCCVLLNQEAVRQLNRDHFGEYFEIFVDVAKETVIRRDPKGLYHGYLSGEVTNVVGMDIEFVPPAKYDFRVDNTRFVDVETTIQEIVGRLSTINSR